MISFDSCTCRRLPGLRLPGLCVAAAYLLFALLGLGLAASMTTTAMAQVLAATVNGDPITTTDIAMRMKMLAVQHKPASREAALEDLIADRLKLHESGKYGIDATEADEGNFAGNEARALNLTPQVYVASFSRAGVSSDHLKAHLRSVAAWNNYVHALNKTVGISEKEIAAEMAKQDKHKQTVDYVMHQVVLVVPINSGGEILQRRMREAEALRNRFTDCATGLRLAQAMPETAVKEQIARNAASFSTELRDMLDRTPVGHLTVPTRGPNGVEMLAVCEKHENADDSTFHDRIEAMLLDQRLKRESDRLYQELRSRAVVQKR
jgi:peptidyl-prolyl cis-trans isomerase SurA